MKNEKLARILENLGLSDNEASVYLASLSIGPSTILKIAQAAEIKRTTVYSVIETLKQKGLIRIEIKGFKQLYAPESPEKLEGMINTSRDQLVHSLPEFMALYNLEGGESFIKYYEGMEACKTVYENIIKEAKPGDFLLVVSDQEIWYNQDPEYFQGFMERRSKIGLKVRKLLQSSRLIDEIGWGTPKFNEEIKLLPQGTNLATNMFIMPHKVVIHQIVPPILAIEIENKSVVRMNKEMFEIMWRSIPGPDGEKMDYKTYTERQLKELENALKTILSNDMNIIDVGGVSGNTEKIIDNNVRGSMITAVNHVEDARDKITQENYRNSSVKVSEDDPTQFFEKKANKDSDLIIFKFVLHEIIDPIDQLKDLSKLLGRAKSFLRPGGKVVICDFFYDSDVTDQEIVAFRTYLKENLGHADTREQFINPDLILEVAQDLNFKILHFHQNRAVKEIDRKYYVFILENKE